MGEILKKCSLYIEVLSLAPGLTLAVFNGIDDTLNAIQEFLGRCLLHFGNLIRILVVERIGVLQLLNSLLGAACGCHGNAALKNQLFILKNA